jgi:hypothetical protein
MALTRAERRIVGEIEELLRIGGYDWRVVEELYELAARRPQLERIKLGFIRMKVIGDYVFADEMLTSVIVAYFFPPRKFPKRWKDKRIRTFVHFVMERLFMLQKLALVKQIRKFDRAMARTLERLDALRNAMAHSFMPETRREYREKKKVIWEGRDIYTTEGIEQFDADMRKLTDYLVEMAFGKAVARLAREPSEGEAA